MAVEAVASAVIQKVTDLVIQDAIIFYKVIDQVEDIRMQLRQLQGFLKDAKKLERRDESDEDMVKKYLETVYDVEDIVESYVLSLAHKKRGMGFLQNYGFFFHDFIACQNLRRKMKKVEMKIEKLNQNLKNESRIQSLSPSLRCTPLGPDPMESQQLELNPCSYGGKEDSEFIGFKEYMDLLVNQLLSNNNARIIIPVVGRFGAGKTTLVRRAYHHQSIRAQFKCRAWLDVSEDHNPKDLMLKIWNQVIKKHEDRQLTILDEAQIQNSLSELLSNKYLIVLDDARNHLDHAWAQLIRDLPGGRYGSKVVLITRDDTPINENHLGLEGWSQPLCIEPLRDNESWKLFLKRLCLDVDLEAATSPVIAFRRKILNKCLGLPLNIALLGGLLSTKKFSHEEWARLFNHPHCGSSEMWLLSYNDLPPHYKLCLLYMGLFPKGFGIPVRRILRLWVAEGFLPRSTGLSEDFAQECLNYLVKRNLIKITKFRSDGGPKVCLMPGYLREHLDPMTQDISLFHIHHLTDPQAPQGVRRRIVEYTDIKDYAPGSNSKSDDVKNLRSYLSFNFPKHDAPAKQVGNFLSKIIGNKGFGLLRVLDLEGVYKPTLPNTLKHLLQLRYLGLRWTFLDILPEAVGDLPYLETLDLKRTYINHLPNSVWKLQHLRHLNLPEVWLDMHMLQPRSQLQTLWGLIIDDGYNHLEKSRGLDWLVELRELGITCRHLTDFTKLMDWIARLTRLHSLCVKSIDNMHRPYVINLQPLSDLANLHYLEVLGKLNQLPETNKFPPHLKVLTLSLSYLTQDPMQTLSQLPCLAVLRLLANSYTGQKMQCPPKGFHHLITLKLWMLEELEEWTVLEEGMPCIRELNIRHCQKMKKLPIELLNRPTLEELVLDDMPQEFKDNTEKNKSDSTVLTINNYKFSPLPWEKDADLWS